MRVQRTRGATSVCRDPEALPDFVAGGEGLGVAVVSEEVSPEGFEMTGGIAGKVGEVHGGAQQQQRCLGAFEPGYDLDDLFGT